MPSAGRHRGKRAPLFTPKPLSAHTTNGALAFTVVATSLTIPATVAPAMAAPIESTGDGNSPGTVNGHIITMEPGGLAPWDLHAPAGEVGVGGVRVAGYWIDADGVVSETYYTTSAADGTYSLKFPDYTDAQGVEHTFRSTFFERMKVWVEPNTLPAGRELAYSEGRQMLHGSLQRDRATWLFGRVDNQNFALREKTNTSLHSTEHVEERPRGGRGSPPNILRGQVFWDNAHLWGGGEWFPIKSRHDKGAGGIRVTATLQRPSGEKYTAVGFTNSGGHYKLYFPDEFDPDWLSSDKLYVSIDAPAGFSYYTPFDRAEFYDTNQLRGSTSGWDSLSNVNFALYPDASARFSVLTYNTTSTPASPGTTVSTSATGLQPGRKNYSVVWKDDRGEVVHTCRNLTASSNGDIPSCPMTVPSFMSRDITYTASLINSFGDVVGSDAFRAIAFRASAALDPGQAGVAYSHNAVTVTGGQGPFTYTAIGLPDGVAMNAATGEVAGIPATHGEFFMTVTVTDSTGQKAVTSAPWHVDPAALTASATLSAVTVGETFEATEPTVAGGVGPYRFAIAGLPAGVTMDPATGIVSGTPSAAGSFPLTWTVTDTRGTSTTAQATLTIAAVPITVTVDNPWPAATKDVPYVAPAPSATGGDGTFTWSATGLPAGLNVDADTGLVTGTPTTRGTFPVTVTATDGTGATGSAQTSITVGYAPLVLTPIALPDGKQGDGYTTAALASTGGDGSYTYSATGLPQGVDINAATGALSGSPTDSGAYTVTITVTDGQGATASFTDDIAIAAAYDPLVVTVPSWPTGQLGQSYTGATPNATGGDGDYTWTATGLPAGLTIDASTGVITGTPTEYGAADVAITLTDGHGTSASTSGTILIAAAPVAVTANPGDGQVGVAYTSPTPSATGGDSDYTWSASGLPAGLTINTSTGVISGTPTAAGTLNVTITATDGTGAAASSTYVIVMGTADVDVTMSLAPAQATVPYTSAAPTTTGGTGTYTYHATGLPSGMSIAPATGVISGTASQSGTHAVVVTARDEDGKSDSVSVNLVVSAAPLSIDASAPDGRVGTAFTAPAPEVAGGTGTKTFTAANLPGGLNIDGSTGVVSGTPTTAGTFTYTLTVRDANSVTASDTVTITVEPPPVTITVPAFPTATATVAYNAPAANANGGRGALTYSASDLPTGLTIDLSTGAVSGTPDGGTVGTHDVTITATDADGRTASVTQTLTVIAPLAVPLFDYKDGIRGTHYSDGDPNPTGGNGDYSFSVSAGALPNGLTLDDETGEITGTPSAAGTFTVDVTVADSNNVTSTFTDTIVIAHPELELSVTLSDGTATVGYGGGTLVATGGDEHYTYAAPGLPNGLSLDTSTGAVTGTPTEAGTFVVNATVTDGAGSSTTTPVTITIEPQTLDIDLPALANAAVGTAYSQATAGSVTGGAAPVQYSATGLPPGLSIDSNTGVISGTPTAHGNYSVTVIVMDANGTTSRDTATIAVAPPALSLTDTAPDATVDVAYSASIATAAGGVGPYTYAVTAGSLPGGLTLDAATGQVTGSPTAHGTSTFTVQVTDSLGATKTTSVTIETAPAPLTLTAGPLPAGQNGEAYSAGAPTVGGGTGIVNVTFADAGLPAGLAIDVGTGAITGTPTTHGTFTVTVTATDSGIFAGNTASVQRDLVIAPQPLELSAMTLPDGTEGAGYTGPDLTVTGGSGGTSFSQTGLPTGLTFNTSTGKIGGTPTESGFFTVTITATDDTGHTATTTDSFVIAEAHVAPTLTYPEFDDVTRGEAFTGPTPTVTGSDLTRVFTATGLPDGMSIDSTTGVISGTVAAKGTHAVTVTVTDGHGSTDTHDVTITVVNPTLTLTANQPDGVVDVPYVAPAPTSAGGDGRYTYAITAGSLPSGLSLDTTTGVVSGTPDTPGDYTWTYTVTSAGATATAEVTVVIAPAPLVLTVAHPDATEGVDYTGAVPVVQGGVPEAGNTYTFSAAGLPAGLVLNTSTGQITGTPESHGSHHIALTVKDSRGALTTHPSTLVVNPAPLGATYTLANGTADASYSASGPTVTGGIGPYTFAAVSIPDGLTLDADTGALTGAPAVSGNHSVTLSITDAAGTSITRTATFDVANAPLTLAAELLDGEVGVAYASHPPVALGGSGSYSFTSSALPAGLSLHGNTGVIYGTPTTPGSTDVTIRVHDGATTTDLTKTLTIVPAPLSFPATTLPAGAQGVAYNATLTPATGGSGSYTYTVTALPNGLSFHAGNLEIFGIPTVSGSFPITVSVKDSKDHIATYGATIALDAPVVAPLILTPAELPHGVVGSTYYGPSLETTGGAGHVRTFTATGLPDGLNIDEETGELFGTPTQHGTFTPRITTTDSQGATASYTAPLTIDPAELELVAALPEGSVNHIYLKTTVEAHGGVGPYTYTATGLPPGLTLSNAGVLSGTPTAAGHFNLTITATDTLGAAVTVIDHIIVTHPPIALEATYPGGAVGEEYTGVAPSVSGTIGATTFTADHLPPGLAMNSGSGAITGTPTLSGDYHVDITVTDSTGAHTRVTHLIAIAAAPLRIQAAALPSANVGDHYHSDVPVVTGGLGPHSFDATGLPPGLHIEHATGIIRGIPTAAGDYLVTITTTDAHGATAAFTGLIAIGTGTTLSSLAITTALIPDGVVGTHMTAARPGIAGGTGPYTFTATGLPPGLTINPGDGSISGTPTTYGDYLVTVTVTDSTGITASYTDGTTIADPVLHLEATLPTAIVGTPVTLTPTVTGGHGPYTYDATGLPAGLTINHSTGEISGTPTTPGDYNATITVTDAHADTTTAGLVTHVDPPALTLSVTLPPGTIDAPYVMDEPVATGGVRPLAFSATGLPPGLTVDPLTGTLTGVPIEHGSYTVIYEVHDEFGDPTSANATLIITPRTLDIVSDEYPTGSVGELFTSPTPHAVGGKKPYTYTATGLPLGLTIDANTGVVTGTPAGDGTHAVTVTVRDDNGATASFTELLVVGAGDNQPVFSVDGPHAGTAALGQEYHSEPPAHYGAIGNVRYTATGLPPGLSIDATTGVISGTPTATGSYTTTVTLRDDAGRTASFSMPFVVTTPSTSLVFSAPSGQVGVTYTSPAPAVTGASGNVGYAATGLPPGLRIDEVTGVISGTPTRSGSYTITLRATLTDGVVLTATHTVTIAVRALSVGATDWFPDATVGVDLTSAAPTVTGGTGPYTFEAVGLPPGLMIAPATGIVTGTPTTAGDYTITLTIRDAAGRTATTTHDLTVVPNALTISGNASYPAGLVGRPYFYPGPTVTGGTTPYTFTLATTEADTTSEFTSAARRATMPRGLILNPATGAFIGTPTVAGDYPVTLTVTDANGLTTTLTSIARILPELDGEPVDLPDGSTGTPYTAAPPDVSSLPAPVRFDAINLPPGLGINPTSGVISGTPTRDGNYPVTITATDADGDLTIFTDLISIGTVGPLTFTSEPGSTTAVIGRLFTHTPPAFTGGNGFTTWSADNLPPGLTIDPTTGAISGRPTREGTWNVALTVRDGAGDSATTLLTITVGDTDLAVTIPQLRGVAGAPMTPVTISATGGAPSYTFSATGLPPGVSIDPAKGVINGTPATAGRFDVRITVTDAAGFSASASTTLTVAGAADGPRGPLSRTGADVVRLAVVGASFIAGGVVLLLARSRHRRRPSD